MIKRARKYLVGFRSQVISLPWRRALRPGLGIKRWLLLLGAGVVVIALALAVWLRAASETMAWPRAVEWLTLSFLPSWARVALLLGVGAALIGYAIWRIAYALADALLPGFQSSSRTMLAALLQRQRRQGPRVVAIGGGTGMPLLLRGLRAHTDNITAIVTVADDGGSSGRLRRQMGMLPPGDFRNNIAALSEAEDLMTRLFQYRFADREVTDAQGQGSELAGHSFGNLFIATMAAVTGSFEAGIAESSRVLAVRGRVLPSTLEQVVLCAEVRRVREDGSEEWLIVDGESRLPESGGQIMRVYLKPEAPRAYPEAVRAILQADLIVACPGSFYTSLIPNLLVPAIRDAIEASAAQRVYLCNVATQPGETDHYTVSDHMETLRRHAGNAFTAVLANRRYDPYSTPSPYGQWVTLPGEEEEPDYRLFTGDLVDERLPWHHDSRKLAARLMEVYEELRSEAQMATQAQQSAHTFAYGSSPKQEEPALDGTNVPVSIRSNM